MNLVHPTERIERRRDRQATYLAEVHADAKQRLTDALSAGEVDRVVIPARLILLPSGRTTAQYERRAGDLLIDGITSSQKKQDGLATFLAGCLKSSDGTVRRQAELLVSIAAQSFADDEEARAEAEDL